jgi:hypothetical protein
MVFRFTNCLRRLVLGLGVLSCGTGAWLHPSSAQAEIAVCRSDPAILLSNGVVLDVGAEVQTNPRDVRSISYLVHLPKNVSALAVRYSGDISRRRETVTSRSDGRAGSYDMYVKVATYGRQLPIVAVTVTARLLGASSATVRGRAGRRLHIHVTAPRTVR